MAFISLVVGFVMTALFCQPELFSILQEHKVLIQDWTTQPFVDVLISHVAVGCPDQYEPLFDRMWNGTNPMCFSEN